MKSRITTLLAVLLMAVGSASAQEKTTIDDVILDLEVSAGTRYHGLQQVNGAIDVGYCLFDRVYPYFRYESSLMLYKHEGSKTYGNTSNIGGGLGVVLLQWDDEDKKGNKEQVRFEFTGNVTTSVGRDYKNTSFYGGFRMRSRDHFVGLGFRLNLDMFIIRLDIGVPIHDPNDVDASYFNCRHALLKNLGWNLAVGYPF